MKYIRSPYRLYVEIVNIIADILPEIPARMKSKLMNVSVAVLIFIGILKYCNKPIKMVTRFFYWSIILGTVMMIVFLIASIEKKRYDPDQKIRRPFWIGWMVCFVWILMMSFVHPPEDVCFVWAVVSLTISPLIFITWEQNCRMEKMMDLVADRTVTAAYLFVAASVFFVPFINKEALSVTTDYLGMGGNPNHNGMLSTGFYSAALYMLLSDKKRPFRYLILMGVCIALSVVSVTRASILAVIMETFAAMTYILTHRALKNSKAAIVKQMLVAVVIVTAAAVVAGYGFRAIDNAYIPLKAEAASEITEEKPEKEVAQKLDNLSSGRIHIWKAYIEKSTFWGNGWSEDPLIEGSHTTRWPHNTAIDILYVSGVPAAAGYVLWLGTSLVFIMRSIISKDRFRKEYLFSMIVIMGYFAEAMLEVTIYPMTNWLAFIALLGLIPVAYSEQRLEKSEE